jgi:ATP-dependent 26S proteasome regulatory subunit
MSPAIQPATGSAWHQENYRCLAAELARLRLRARRRAMWIRSIWQQDPLRQHQATVTSDGYADALLAGESRAAELAFWCENPEAAALTAQIRKYEERVPGASALDSLVRLFALTPFERDVLLLCLLPELDPALERLYGYLQDDMARRFATPQLALAVYCDDPGAWLAARDCFSHTAPLLRFRLLTIDAGPAALAVRAIRLDERMADYLLGVNQLDARVRGLLTPLPEALLAPEQQVWLDRIWAGLEAGTKSPPQPLWNLVGPPRSGRAAVARGLCDRAGLDVRQLDPTRLPQDRAEREQVLRLIEREALLLEFAVYIEEFEADPAGGVAAGLSVEELDDFQAIAIVAGARAWQGARATRAISVDRPDAGVQRQLWRAALNGTTPASCEIDRLVQQFDLGPREISQAAAYARSADSADLWDICRDRFASDLENLAQRVRPCYEWDDIVLPSDSARQLREIAGQVKLRPQVYDVWGFGAKLSRGRGISALFAGPSGTGKTMAAEVLAADLRLNLYRIDLAGVVSKYIGETEKNLRRIFDAAEESGAILFFDEADALFGKRVEVREAHDRYANIEINYLLQRMEDYRGLAILATNKKSHMDEAFLRRLRFLVDFPFPDAVQRRRIWERSIPAEAETSGLDFASLSRLEISGGSIRNVVLNAAFLAAGEGAPIGMDHVLLACRREYAKIDKLVAESEFGRYYPQVQR